MRFEVNGRALRFEEVLERHHDEIFAYLWRLLGKERHGDGAMDVEDLVQDAFVRAYQAFPGLRPNSNHRAWLYKIATHCAYSNLKKIRHRRDQLASLANWLPESGAASDFSPARKSMEQKVRALVNGLPAQQRVCVTLRYLQDLDYREIAQIVGCTQESVRANVYQAIRRLRLALEEEI